jgi:hypothetical protein
MPIGEQETHPYLSYLPDHFELMPFQSIIIGSFPIYCITESIPIEEEGKRKRVNWKQEASHKSFYGSKSNKTRKLINILYPNKGDSLESILTTNITIVTDAVKSCQRNSYSALDKDLRHLETNDDLLKYLELPSIKYVYFTALNNGLPFLLFKKIVRKKYKLKQISYESIGTSNNKYLKINDRQYSLGFLESPSPTAEMYKNSKNWKRYILVNPNSSFWEFILEQWTQLLLKNNFEYIGNNPIA